MTWLSLAAALVSLAVAIIKWLEGRGQVEAALSEAILKGLREADALIEKAKVARVASRAESDANPDSMPDDGWRRD